VQTLQPNSHQTARALIHAMMPSPPPQHEQPPHTFRTTLHPICVPTGTQPFATCTIP